MNGDGSLADKEGPGDLAVAVALGQQTEHLRLAFGEVEPGTEGSSR